MAFGITAVNAHLNARKDPPDPLEINWAAYKIWNNDQSPGFAGRYFLGRLALWEIPLPRPAEVRETVDLGPAPRAPSRWEFVSDGEADPDCLAPQPCRTFCCERQ